MVVHAPQSWSGAALTGYELTEALRATGYSIRSPVRVRFKISRDNVRYFHASDAEAAAALAAAFGARVRFYDFTASGAAPSRRTPGAAFGARVRDFTHSTSGKWQSLNCSVRRASRVPPEPPPIQGLYTDNNKWREGYRINHSNLVMQLFECGFVLGSNAQHGTRITEFMRRQFPVRR